MFQGKGKIGIFVVTEASAFAETTANTDKWGSHFQTVNLTGSAGCVLPHMLKESAIPPNVGLMTSAQGKSKGMNYGC